MLKYSNTTKKVNVMSFLKMLRFLTAHYFHTVSNKFVKWAHIVYCVIFCVFVVGYSAFPVRATFTATFAQFLLSVVTSLVTADEYFFKYCRATESLDVVMRVKSCSIFDNKVRCLMIILILFRIYCICFATSEGHMGYVYLCRLIFLINERVDCFIVTLIFYIAYTRMNILRERVQRNPVPINIVKKDSVMNIAKGVRRFLLNYNNLLDNFHAINQDLQYLMSIILLCSVPKNIIFNYLVLGHILTGSLQWRHIIQQLEVVEVLVLVCLPAVLAGLIRNDVDKIRKSLARQLLRCSDESLRCELQVALDYVTRRPFTFVLFGAVPVDINLPINIISLCITYVIVVMQFTHLNKGL